MPLCRRVVPRMLMPALLCSTTLGVDASAQLAPAAPPSSRPRAITHEDLWLMRRLGAPQVSPDGRWVVVSVLEPAYDERAQASDLWLVTVDGTRPPRRLTQTAGRESGVTWAPDSRRIAFSARRGGDETEQVYVLSLEGGEAMRATAISTGARSPQFSPDGGRILFSSSVWPEARDDEDSKRVAAARRARKWNARIYEGFPIRNWDEWLDERQTRVFVQALPGSGTAPVPRDLLAGTALVREPGFAGRTTDTGFELDAVWSPDGRFVLFCASRNRHRAAFDFTNSDLYAVPVAGGEPIRLTDGVHAYSQPRFTPDGRRLLALGERRNGKVYVATRLVAFDWSSRSPPSPLGPGRWLTEDFDRSVTAFASTADSARAYFLAEEAGHEKLFVVSLAGAGRAQRVFDTDRGVYTQLVVAERARGAPVLVANWESATSPPEVVSINPASGSHLRLTAFNVERARDLDLPPVRHFWFTSRQGRRIHNMLVLPPGFDPNRRYPLFNVIHGGPHTMWRDQWVLRWNYHLLAAPGYVVLLSNYSGSTGFGESFAQHIQGDPLRSAGEELNEAADEALRQFPFIDASRQCAGGASYGGHLANWLQATTNRYRCLVSHAGLVNLESQWGTSDTVYGREVNNGGPVWEQGPVWREQSPIRRAANFRTPTLVTIGEQDFRVPLNNALEYWTVLQRRQVPSRLVVFPDENHWILKGENSRLFYDEIHAWLARWLRPDEGTARDGFVAPGELP